jgi:sugar O-acyltransferase (sialic acid O-acetyltransferase NeuD family)
MNSGRSAHLGTKRELCLIGGGEHASVVVNTAAELGDWSVLGFWGPHGGPKLKHLGSDEDLEETYQSDWAQCYFHLAIVGRAGGHFRRQVLDRMARLNPQWATLIHPRAYVSSQTSVPPGCFVGPGAIINTGAALGEHVIVNSGALVEHDSAIGRGVHIAQGARLGGGVVVGEWAVIGLGAMVRDHVSIGDGAVIGMGAVVLKDVAPGQWVVGNPAAVITKGGPNGQT